MKKIIFLIALSLILVKPVWAKTVMIVEPGNITINHEEQVLGISSDNEMVPAENRPTLLNLAEKVLTVSLAKGKLLIGFTRDGDVNQGVQEVDELVVKKAEDSINVMTENGKVLLKEKLSEVSTTLPLIIKQSVGQFLVQTPTGQKIISYYPKDVIEKLQKTGVLEINNLPVKLELKEDGTRLVYVLSQEKAQKLFGLIPLKTNITTTVSAQTGEIESQFSPWYSKFLRILSV